MLIAAFFGDDISETRFPYLAVERGGAQSRLGKAGFAQQLELVSAQFLAAQFRRITGVRIDQQGRDAARPSIAAVVEPARPPPTIATSVYRMSLPPADAILAPKKAKKP